MASCDFIQGLNNVHGTISKHVRYVDGKKVVTRVVAKVTSSGKQKVYIQKTRERTTKLSDNEIKARELFDRRTKEVKRLKAELGITAAEAWKIAKETIF